MNFRVILFSFFFSFLLISCGTSKRSHQVAVRPEIAPLPKKEIKKTEDPDLSIDEMVEEDYALGSIISEYAKAYLGTRYKFGGTTSHGMDCSGLVQTAFKKVNIELPRISREMSLLGKPLQLQEVTIGDLLFFETDRRKKSITHVGLVVSTDEEDIYFIHSTNSQGVIISSMKQAYWKNAFVLAKRVL